MRTRCVSLCQLKIHEFYCTLRYIKLGGENWHSIYIRLGEMVANATARAIKQSSALLVTYLLLDSFGDSNEVKVTIGGVSASIPTAYVAMVSSLFVYINVQQYQIVLMLIVIRARESVRMRLRRFSANAYGLYHGQDEMALVAPVVMTNFFSEKIPSSKILMVTMLLCYSFTLLPLASYSFFLAALQFDILLNATSVFERTVALVGIFVLSCSALFLLLFNLPLPIKKNQFGIRWGLLSFLHPIGKHPQIEKWLEN